MIKNWLIFNMSVNAQYQKPGQKDSIAFQLINDWVILKTQTTYVHFKWRRVYGWFQAHDKIQKPNGKKSSVTRHNSSSYIFSTG